MLGNVISKQPTTTLDAHRFFTENNVLFVTGATGFVGKAFVEKVLRSYPQVRKIFVLTRPSKDKTIQQRIQTEILDCRICDTLKSQFPTIQEFYDTIGSKFIPIQGDLSGENLGISDQDLILVRSETRAVISCAASTRHDDSLAKVLDQNVNGPLKLIKLAREMPNLASFMHVSTSYVNSFSEGTFAEELYPYPLGDPKEVFEKIQQMSVEEQLDYEKNEVLKWYPNTYSCAKSLTEHLLAVEHKKSPLPLVICRPATIGPAFEEPVPGWVEGNTGVSRIALATATGQTQEWIGVPSNNLDIIPIDYVIKMMILNLLLGPSTLALPSPPIYQSGSSSMPTALTAIQFGTYCLTFAKSTARPVRAISNDVRFEFYKPSEFWARYKIRFGHLIEALSLPETTDKEKFLINRTLHRATAIPTVYQRQACSQWVFKADKAVELDDKRAPKELRCGLKDGIDWGTYMTIFNIGLWRYMLSEEPRFLRKVEVKDGGFEMVRTRPKPVSALKDLK
ncbi:cyclin-dependent kinase inhibitor far1 [Linnemannia zychae]|nr:cyclin-dependent kinase inhibitor far1 [Linnemannia zychae]